MTHQTDCQSLKDVRGQAPCTCTPPPRQEGMTRVQFKEHVKACAEAKLSELYYAYRDALIAHDAAQRETITRLEGEVKRYELGEVVVANRIRELQARLTASEERIHSITESVLTTFKWEFNLDSGGKDGPIFRRKDWQTSFEPIVYTMTIEEIIQQGLPTRQAKRWTRERPTVAGWYWWRIQEDSDPFVVEVVREGGKLWAQWIRRGRIATWLVSDHGGEWKGPLTPGEE